jgi:protein-tyrosine-phosphatase
MTKPKRQICVVCTGNICRSPMAERLLAHALKASQPPLNRLTVVSAGVGAGYGEPASQAAVKALDRVGLDLRDHRSQPLTRKLVDGSLLVLVMTESHRVAIRDAFPELAAPVRLWREFLPNGPVAVSDPYGGSLDEYLDTRDNLAEAIPSILNHLASLCT